MIRSLATLLLALAASSCSSGESPVPAPSPALTAAAFHDSLRPLGFVLQEKDWHIWCNAPVRAKDGTIHLFVSRWPVKDSFAKGWHTSCEIAHYKAARAEGPYTYVDTVLKGDGKEGSWRQMGTHNVTVVPLPDGRYALLFIANSGGDRKSGGFPANQKIGLMLADSLDGPWRLAGQDGLILDLPQDPAVWSHDSQVGVNNPTLLPMPDGRFFLYYKAMTDKTKVRQMGLAIAAKVEGPYVFQKEPLTRNQGTIEDGFAFHLDGHVALLVTDCHSKDGYGGGDFYLSKDGISFDKTTVRAYEPVDHYMKRWSAPAKGWTPWVLQRPALLFDAQGHPSHLFAPCGTPPEGAKGTATFVFAIEPAAPPKP